MATIHATSTVSSGDWTIVGGAASLHQAVSAGTTGTVGAQSPLAPASRTLKLALPGFGTTPVRPVKILVHVEQVQA